VADMSEDLSEGEKGDTVGDLSAHGDSVRGRLPRINSVDAMEAWVNQQKGKKLYIILIRHGLNFSSLSHLNLLVKRTVKEFSRCRIVYYNIMNGVLHFPSC